MSREDCSDSSTSTSNGFSGSPAADTTAFAGSMVVTSGDSLDASAVYPIAMEGCGDSEDSGDVGWSNPDAVMKGNAMEEKIFVTVRLRPLNSKEISGSERLAWECSDDKTVVCLYNRPDRHFPQSYSFGETDLNCFLHSFFHPMLWLQRNIETLYMVTTEHQNIVNHSILQCSFIN